MSTVTVQNGSVTKAKEEEEEEEEELRLENYS